MVSQAEPAVVARAVSVAPARSRPVALWLFAVAALTAAMVVVGGATRLTGSGLSITEWDPIVGAAPPLSARDWAHAFALYRASAQYHLVNSGIGLSDFRTLFWWEWSHRLLARLVGGVFAVPFAVFLARGAIPRRLRWRCWGLLGLGGLQALAGWWMVESGLEGRAYVLPERLAVHLGLALALFAAAVWTGLEAWAGPRRGARRGGWTRAATAFALVVFLQCLLGAVVAGNHAGLMDGDWPLMAGRLIPEGYWQGGAWRTLVHGMAAAQFNHRVLAYGLVAFALAMAVAVARSGGASTAPRAEVAAICAVILLQAALGVAVLLNGVPLGLALAHQANAVALFLLAVHLAWRVRRTAPVS